MDNVVVAKLVKRYPEKEMWHDNKNGIEYWSWVGSDGKKGEGLLYHSQLFCAVAYETRNRLFKKIIPIVDSNLSRAQMIRQLIILQKGENEADGF